MRNVDIIALSTAVEGEYYIWYDIYNVYIIWYVIHSYNIIHYTCIILLYIYIYDIIFYVIYHIAIDIKYIILYISIRNILIRLLRISSIRFYREPATRPSGC